MQLRCRPVREPIPGTAVKVMPVAAVWVARRSVTAAIRFSSRRISVIRSAAIIRRVIVSSSAG